MKRRTTLIIVSGVAAAIVAGGATTIAVAQDGSSAPPSGGLQDAGAAAQTAAGGGDVVSVEWDDDRAGYEVEIRRADGSEVDVDLSSTYDVLRTEDEIVADRREDHRDDADDIAPVDADLGRASEAALAAVGEGSVSDVEWDDGGYDVEIRTADRREFDVRLDAAFTVITSTEDVAD
ncbi:MAG: PepSY domain-containing protein [Ilumatobacteraceae bacterium]